MAWSEKREWYRCCGYFMNPSREFLGIRSVEMDVSIPHVPPGDEVRVSATTYVTWKRCPESANARLQGSYGPDTRPQFLGTLAHRIFAKHLTDGPIASADFAQVCKEEIGKSGLNHKMGPLGIKPSSLDSVIAEVQALYERFTRLGEDGFEGSEVSIDHETVDGVRLLGKVDAVYKETDGGHRLVDWKTGTLGDAEQQLDFYAFLWAVDRSELPTMVEAVSVKTGERYHTIPSTGDVSRVAGEVSELATDMRDSWATGVSLQRRGGPWCQYCPILADCEEGQATEALLS